MKVPLEISDSDARALLSLSLGRILDTALSVIENASPPSFGIAPNDNRNALFRTWIEDRDISIEDLYNHKALYSRVFFSLNDAIYRAVSDQEHAK